jgi:hypothetical protein
MLGKAQAPDPQNDERRHDGELCLSSLLFDLIN